MRFEELGKGEFKDNTAVIFCPGPTLRLLREELTKEIPKSWPKIGVNLAIRHRSVGPIIDYWIVSGAHAVSSAGHCREGTTVIGAGMSTKDPRGVVTYDGPARGILMALDLAREGGAKRVYIFGLDLYCTTATYYFMPMPRPPWSSENQRLGSEIIRKRSIAGDADKRTFATPRLKEMAGILERLDVSPMEVVVVGSRSGAAPYPKMDQKGFVAATEAAGDEPPLIPQQDDEVTDVVDSPITPAPRPQTTTPPITTPPISTPPPASQAIEEDREKTKDQVTGGDLAAKIRQRLKQGAL